jgi:phosphatidylglycerophosphate synthase
MFDTPLRKFKDQVGAPLAQSLKHVHPSFITAVALVTGLLAAWFAFTQSYFVAFGFWILNRVLDGLDGLMARLHSKQSDFGGYLDILTDFIVYAALPIGLVAGSPTMERYLILAFMLASFYVNSASWMYLSAILEKRALHTPDTQTTIVMPTGIIGGFETILAYGIFLLFPAHITALFSIFAALVLVTIVQRLLWAKQNLTPETWNLTYETQFTSPRLHPANPRRRTSHT